jgi:hypothetical protein
LIIVAVSIAIGVAEVTTISLLFIVSFATCVMCNLIDANHYYVSSLAGRVKFRWWDAIGTIHVRIIVVILMHVAIWCVPITYQGVSASEGTGEAWAAACVYIAFISQSVAIIGNFVAAIVVGLPRCGFPYLTYSLFSYFTSTVLNITVAYVIFFSNLE